MSGLFGGGKSTTISTTETAVLGVRIQSSAYGLPIPIVYGRNRVPGNLIWYGDFTPVPHTTTTSSGGGGKGGGHHVTSTNTTYTYTASFALALAEGPIAAINGCWKDKEYVANACQTLVSYGDPVSVVGAGYTIDASLSVAVNATPGQLYSTSGLVSPANGVNFIDRGVVVQVPMQDGSALLQLVPGLDYTFSAGVYTFPSTILAGTTWAINGISPVNQAVSISFDYTPATTIPALFSSFVGGYPQSAWSYLSSLHPGQDVTYQGVAYAAAANYDLGASASLPNHTFDVTGALPYNPGAGIFDANPKEILADLLTNSHYGAGFPPPLIGDLSAFSNYCVATGLFLSPVYSSQQAANQTVAALCRLANSAPFFSEGVLKVAPYGDVAAVGNGATYTPNTTALYDLTDDDYLAGAGDEPVRMTRGSVADAFNSVQVEFVNRSNDYNVEIAEARDQVAVDIFGLRTADPVQAHEISDPGVARRVAQLLLQRSLFIRNVYEFTVCWKFCLLEPGDLLTLTDSALGLSRQAVRVTSIEEDPDTGTFTLQAEDWLAGVSSAPRYPVQAQGGYAANYNAKAAGSNTPVIFEPPDLLTVAGLEVWIGASGRGNWGGANVWVSLDGATYKMVGTISNPCRQGVLTTALPSVADPDKTSVVGVDLSVSKGALLSASQADADAFATLCYVDGELIAYRDSTLTGANQYNLDYLRRGAYGSTIGAHAAGSAFLRLDSAVFHYPFTADQIGKTINVKLQSYNSMGGGPQSLADLSPTAYTITGAALYSPLPNVQNVATNFVSGQTVLYWDAVSDFRQPAVDYEVRMGASWAASVVLGRTPTPRFTTVGDGTYWIAAHFLTAGGFSAYSATPTSVLVTGSRLSQNVIASYDEAATSWSGTTSGGAVLNAGTITLQGAGNILTDPNILINADVLHTGGIATSGAYDLPAGHAVNAGRVAPCAVSISTTSYAQSVNDNVLAIADVLGVGDFLSAALGQKIGVQPQIAVADGTGVYGSWQNFVPGTYNAQYFKARVLLSTSDTQVAPYLSGLKFVVDVPDRIDGGTLTTAAGGSSVSYSAPFLGGPAGGGTPLVQVTVVNATAGDDVILSAQSASGFTVQIKNGGVGVARAINWLAQGY